MVAHAKVVVVVLSLSKVKCHVTYLQSYGGLVARAEAESGVTVCRVLVEGLRRNSEQTWHLDWSNKILVILVLAPLLSLG